jgi:hypothetical protein
MSTTRTPGADDADVGSGPSAVPAAGTTASIEIGSISAPQGPRSLRPAEAPASTQWLAEQSPVLVAAVVAAPALVLPLGWLVLALSLSFVILCVIEGRRGHAGRLATADLLVVPSRGFGRAARRVLIAATKVGRVLKQTIGAIAVALAVPAALATVPWLLTRGADGALASCRMAIISHSPRLLAFILAYRLARGGGDVRKARDAGITGRLKRWPDPVVTGICATAIAVVVWIGLVPPVHGWAPFESGESAVDALPFDLTETITEAQASYAESGAQAAIDCLHREGVGLWGFLPAGQDADGSWTIVVGVGDSAPADVAAGAAALHNQLPPYIATLELAVSPDGPWHIDRHGLGTDVPLSPAALVERTAAPPSILAAPLTDRQQSVAFGCSATRV